MILVIIVLLVFIFAKLFIFAMTTIVGDGRHIGARHKIGSYEMPADIHLANLKRYRAAVLDYLGKKLKQPAHVIRDHFGRIFISWIFQANMRGTLDEYFIPTDNVINKEDVVYFCSAKGIRVPKKLVFINKEKPKRATWKVPRLLDLDRALEFAGSSLRLTRRQYERLYALYTDDMDYFNANVYYLLNVYNTLGGLSNNASVPLGWPQTPENVSYIELFGSPLNTQYKYCSPFKDQVEGKFGSLGCFFKFDLHAHTHYIANPPFDEHLMEQMSLRLLDFFDEAKVRESQLTVIVILPVWDSSSQRKIGVPDYNKVFQAYELLIASPYCKSEMPARRETRLFFDYYGDKYRPIANSHIVVMSNTDAPTAEQLHEQWLNLQKQ